MNTDASKIARISYWLVGPEYVAMDLLSADGELIRLGGFDEPLTRRTGKAHYTTALRAAERIAAGIAKRYGVDVGNVRHDDHESAQYAEYYSKRDDTVPWKRAA